MDRSNMRFYKFNLIQDGIGVLKEAISCVGVGGYGSKLGIRNSPPSHVGWDSNLML